MDTKQKLTQWIGALLFLTILLIFAGCSEESTTAPRVTEKVTHEESEVQNLDLSGVSSVDAGTYNGKIVTRGQASTNARLEITTTVRAETIEEAERVAGTIVVDVQVSEGELVIRPSYPDPGLGVEVEVDYELDCPDAVTLDLSAVNGELFVDAMAGAVSASLGNGHIEIMPAMGSHGALFAEATNGDIVVTLDSAVSYELTARTTNGCISGSFEGASIEECRIGIQELSLGTPGGTPCDLRIVNGEIQIHER
jgi:uncharacterized lipoprotein YehR (DUF1307 family)